MQAVILAAGCGSRMGDLTDDIPKAFFEINGRTFYERQHDVLEERVDGITVVLGYGYENVLGELSTADPLVFERWDEYENAESLRLALKRHDDDVLVLNGDVIVSPSVIGRMTRLHSLWKGRYNIVACIPGIQTEHTAIRFDESGTVVKYGKIPGHRHAGVGIIDRHHRRDAIEILARNRDDWYPHVYTETPTKRMLIPPSEHLEINRPTDVVRARERLPLFDQSSSA